MGWFSVASGFITYSAAFKRHLKFAIMLQSSKSDTLGKIKAWKQFLIKLDFPENMPDYSSQAYWQSRYEMEENQHHEWYVDYEILKPFFTELLDPEMEVLELGSGNSNVLGMLHKSGFRHLNGSDFSWNVINKRRNQEKYLKRGIKWEILDITKQWPQRRIDCVLEKAVLDCLPPSKLEHSLRLIYQSLQNKGLFIHVSSMKPERRIRILSDWDVKVYELPKVSIPVFAEVDRSTSYYLYVCTKR